MRKFFKIITFIRFFPHTVFFNFYYLPFRKAKRLPILLYKPKLRKLAGEIELTDSKPKFGSIKLGFNRVSFYPNKGFVWENHGGKCIFNGKCSIGNYSVISIGSKGRLEFGKNFQATAALKVAAYFNIVFKENVLVGWENTFMDTDFHKLKHTNGKFKKGFSNISIGKNNWFGYKIITLKGTSTPDYCTIASGSLLSRRYSFKPYCVIGGNPVKIIAKDVYRDPDNDSIMYDFEDKL